MKSISPKLFISFLTLIVLALGIFNINHNQNIKAQEFICDPPDNYSGCPEAQTGPKIAANIQVENYATIREEYNKAGYENQQIPVTIIYTPTDLDDEHKAETKKNLEAMKANGLIPTVRIYGGYNFDEAEENGRNLNELFSEVKFSRPPIVYGYNEPNLKEEGFHQDPQIYAQQMALLAKGAGDNRNFQLFLSPMAGHQGGAEQQFAIDALNFTTSDGRKLYQLLDGAALTLYQDSPEKFQNEFTKWQNTFNKFGLKNFMISELGPYVGNGNGLSGHLLQDRSQMEEWKKRMTETFKQIVNNGLLKDAMVINTSFFLDTDGDGFPDITLLVVIDKDGNVTIEEQALLIGGGFGWDKFPKIQTTCSVNGKKPDKGDLRPAPCEKCSSNVPNPTSSCAQQPEIVKKTKYTCGDLSQNQEDGCGENWITAKTWDFQFKINTENTKVPFASYRDIDIDSDPIGRSTNMNNYLADYFEGVAFYDGQEYQLAQNIEEKVREDIEARWFWNIGIFRRLAPEEIQDNLKMNLIKSNVNYKVTDGKTTMHMRDWNTKPFAYPKGYFPPDKKQYLDKQGNITQEYFELYKKWQQTKWGKFWPYVPMFTREDAPGKIILTIEHTPGEISATGNGKNAAPYTVEYPLSIPHLARLYQVTKQIHNLLMPTIKKNKQKFAPAKPILKPQTCDTKLGDGIATALGCIPISVLGFAGWVYKLSISIGSGVFIILLIIGAIRLSGSSGDPEAIKAARQLITAAIIGILFIIFSVFIYSLIGAKILKIPKFEAQNKQINNSIANNLENTSSSQQHRTTTLASANIVSDAYGKRVLAQQRTQEDEVTTTIEIKHRSDGTPFYKININNMGSDRGIHIADMRWSDGSPVLNNSGGALLNIFVDAGTSYTLSPEWISNMPTLKEGENNVGLWMKIDDADGWSVGKTTDCQIKKSNGKLAVTKCDSVSSEPTPPQPICKNYSNINNVCIGDNPLQDPNPNDQTCCSSISDVHVPEYKIVVSNQKYQKMCVNPDCSNVPPEDLSACLNPTKRTTMSRKIEVRLEIPYLKEIYKNTIDGTDGFLNIFRPADWEVFPKDDALSGITYEITSGDVGIKDPGVKTQEAELYFPYLGGIQRSKKCISEVMLMPKELQNDYNWCDFSEDFVNPEKGNQISHTKFDPNYNQGCRKVDQSMQSFFDSVNIFDQNINIIDENSLILDQIIDNFKKNPTLSVNIDKDTLKQQFHEIKNTAIAKGWNPAIPLSLWMEESAMGMHPKAKALMGCLDGNDQMNVVAQTQCVLSRNYTQDGFKNFMLTYAGDSNDEFCKNPNFPTNIQYYYQKLLAN